MSDERKGEIERLQDEAKRQRDFKDDAYSQWQQCKREIKRLRAEVKANAVSGDAARRERDDARDKLDKLKREREMRTMSDLSVVTRLRTCRDGGGLNTWNEAANMIEDDDAERREMVGKIAEQRAEIERLRAELEKLDHPELLTEGGTSNAERAIKAINRLKRERDAAKELIAIAIEWLATGWDGWDGWDAKGGSDGGRMD
jgi:DNA repair exonuclease SbcCD ATPase subunit